MTNPTKQTNLSIVLARVSTLHETVTRCYQRSRILDNAFEKKRVEQDNMLNVDPTPEQLEALRNATVSRQLSEELAQLVQYYASQMQQLQDTQQDTSEPEPEQEVVQPVVSPTPVIVEPPVPVPVPVPTPAAPAPSATNINPEMIERRARLNALAARQRQENDEAAARALEAARQRQTQQAARGVEVQAAAQAMAQETQAAPSEAQEQPSALPPAQSVTAAPAARVLEHNMRVLTAYERLMQESHSPLLQLFAAAPWLHNGRGTVTVGSRGFEAWHDGVDINEYQFERLVTLPSGFYGNVQTRPSDSQGEGMNNPKYVVIRLKTTMLIWNFGLGEDDLRIFHSVMNPSAEDLVFRPVRVCSSSTIRRVLEEFYTVYGVGANALVNAQA